MQTNNKPIPLHRTKRLHTTPADILAPVKSYNASPPWNKIDQAFEGSLHSRKIGINIGMIELNMRKDQGVGKVVQELGPLVEERSIVLIPFEQKRPGRPHHETSPEVLRHASNQK